MVDIRKEGFERKRADIHSQRSLSLKCIDSEQQKEIRNKKTEIAPEGSLIQNFAYNNCYSIIFQLRVTFEFYVIKGIAIDFIFIIY